MMFKQLQAKRLFAVSFGHFSIDLLNSSIPIILTAVTPRFDLSVGQIGLAATLYIFAASLSQPLFGILNDKLRGRYVAGFGLLWTMVFYALAPFMPVYPALVACLATAALGSGAFHPAGMVNATVSGGRYPTTATSIFFVLGQSGLALGPTVAGFIVQAYGIGALSYLALSAVPATLAMLLFVRQPYIEEGEEEAAHTGSLPSESSDATPSPNPGTSTASTSDASSDTAAAAPHAQAASAGSPAGNSWRTGQVARRSIYVAVAFILLITMRSTTQQGFMMLLPKFFADLGYSPGVYGTMISVLGIAGAAGTFLGGWLGDRFNRRMIVFASMTFGALFSFLMLNTTGLAYVGVALGAGVMMNIPHSILLIMAQRLLPKRRGMIGGAVLGLMFASGAAMAGIGSRIADFVGLPLVLGVFSLLPLGAAICALALPSTRGIEPAAATTPAKSASSAAD